MDFFGRGARFGIAAGDVILLFGTGTRFRCNLYAELGDGEAHLSLCCAGTGAILIDPCIRGGSGSLIIRRAPNVELRNGVGPLLRDGDDQRGVRGGGDGDGLLVRGRPREKLDNLDIGDGARTRGGVRLGACARLSRGPCSVRRIFNLSCRPPEDCASPCLLASMQAKMHKRIRFVAGE